MIHLLTGMYDSVFSNKEYKVLMVGLDDSGKTSVLERIKLYHKKQQNSGAVSSSAKKDGFAGLTANLKHIGTATTTTTTFKNPKLFDDTPIDTTFIKPTIGLNICRFPGYSAQCDGGVVTSNLLFWDLGGKEQLRKLWYNYAHQCHAVVLVVDASDRARFPEVKKMARELLGHPSLGGFNAEEAKKKNNKKNSRRLAEQARSAGIVPFLVLLNKMDQYLLAEEEQEEQISNNKEERRKRERGERQAAPQQQSSSPITTDVTLAAPITTGNDDVDAESCDGKSPNYHARTQPPSPSTTTTEGEVPSVPPGEQQDTVASLRFKRQQGLLSSSKMNAVRVSVANLFDEIGLLDVALQTSILPTINDEGEEEEEPSSLAAAAAAASSGESKEGSRGLSAEKRHHHPAPSNHQQSSTTSIDIPTTMRGSVGVGQRLFKVCTVSALYEEEAIRVSGMKRNVGKSEEEKNKVPNVGTVRDGLDWLVQYLSQNARHVESL